MKAELTVAALPATNLSLRALVTYLHHDADLQDLVARTHEDVAAKVLVTMLLNLKGSNPKYAPYFESVLRAWQQEPYLMLSVQLAQWLQNQPEAFDVRTQELLDRGQLADDFYQALRAWGDHQILQQVQIQSQIRELYLAELFPAIQDIQVPVGVIHEESHHPNQVDMVYVCAIATILKAHRIFEFGTYRGQTTCGLAAISDEVTVYTLNLPPEQDPRYAPFIGSFIKQSPHQHKVHQIFADSTQFDTSPYAQSIDYIFIDADHSYEGVKNDTLKSLEMLRPGGTIVWHDYAAKSPGVYRFIQEFAADRPVFRIRNTCLIVYIDGLDVFQFEPTPMLSSLENTEYTPENHQRISGL